MYSKIILDRESVIVVNPPKGSSITQRLNFNLERLKVVNTKYKYQKYENIKIAQVSVVLYKMKYIFMQLLETTLFRNDIVLYE